MFSNNTKQAASATAADASRTVSSAKRDLREAASGVDLNAAATEAGRHVRSFIDSASEQLASASDIVAKEVRSNPVRSTAIALGVGLVLGAIFNRK